MSDSVIKVEGVSKKYCRSLRHTMLYGAADLSRSFLGLNQCTEELRDGEFWALDNVSFEIKRGETLGLIGANGSGKSTLLKMLNGIFMPDKGKIEVNGRVGALIEVGAGFHPMLTGRENVYVNGAILGLTKAEIDKKFDEILAFAAIGEFIDTPVKHYSSGMYVRLGFAVAAHAEPDIMLIDEVLAVGDEAFQRKCFSQIYAMKEKGVTVVLVSHSAQTVIELCDRAILISQGESLIAGPPKVVIPRYHKLINAPKDKKELIQKEIIKESKTLEPNYKGHLFQANNEIEVTVSKPYFDSSLKPTSTVLYEPRGAQIKNPRLTTLDGEIVNILVRGNEYIYTYDVEFFEEASFVRFGMMIKTTRGFELGGMLSSKTSSVLKYIEKGKVVKQQFLFKCILLSGTYFMNAGVVGFINESEDHLCRGIDITMFKVQPEPEILATGFVDFSINS